MAKPLDPLVFDDLRYGRDGGDPLLSLPAKACAEAYNVEFYESTLGKKRAGSSLLTLWAGAASENVNSMIRHLPGADESAAELWIAGNDITGAGTDVHLRRLTSAGWTEPGFLPATDAVRNLGLDVRGVSFNGKLFLAFDCYAYDRLHVWDGTGIRRVGLGAPAAAATVANTGAGTYAATIRYYKVANTVQAAGVTTRRSELSAVVSFTPSGTGTAARVTKPAETGEGETHWELYASADALTYVKIATTAVGTTTYDDSTAPASYTGDAEPVVGTNTPPTSVKYLAHDGGNRLLMAGSWEGTARNRVWYTPVLGSSDIGGDERIPNTLTQKNWIDLEEKDGGYITGIIGPLLGSMYVFKQRQIWKLVPTGVSSAPYTAICLSRSVGALRQNSIVLGEDEDGQPCLYFLSYEGPYRLGMNGIQYCGRDVEDLWRTVKWTWGYLGWTCGIYYAEKKQVWFKFITASNTYEMMVLQVNHCQAVAGGVHGGWSRYSNGSGEMVMFSEAVGASMSGRHKPYLAGLTEIQVADSGTLDKGTTKFQAYVKTRVLAPAGLRRKVRVDEPILLARAADQTDISVELIKDTGTASRVGTVSLTPEGSEQIVTRRVEGLGENDLTFLQFQIGDAEASAAAWNLDALEVPLTGVDPR